MYISNFGFANCIAFLIFKGFVRVHLSTSGLHFKLPSNTHISLSLPPPLSIAFKSKCKSGWPASTFWKLLKCKDYASCMDRVPYFSYLTKTTFLSHTANMATFVVLRHLITILVTDLTNPDNFDLLSFHSQLFDNWGKHITSNIAINKYADHHMYI